MPIKHPDFLCKCQIQPNSQDQWQIAKSILKFKSTHPIGTIFNGIRFGWIFFTIKRSLAQCVVSIKVDIFLKHQRKNLSYSQLVIDFSSCIAFLSRIAGPNLSPIILVKWDSFKTSKAEPSIECSKNTCNEKKRNLVFIF